MSSKHDMSAHAKVESSVKIGEVWWMTDIQGIPD